MTPKFTHELRQALAEQPGHPLTVEDPVTHTQYVFVQRDVFEQFQLALGDDGGKPDQRAFYPAVARAVKDDLDVPSVEGYDNEKRKRERSEYRGVNSPSPYSAPGYREGGETTMEVPLRCGQALLGTVSLDGQPQGAFSGVLTPGPDFERYRPLFDRVFLLQRRIDEASDEEYQAAWCDWHRSLEAIEQLGLSFGDDCIPVEGFEVDDCWRVSFHAAVWWVASFGDRNNP